MTHPSQYGPFKYANAEMDTNGMQRYMKRVALLEQFAEVVRAAVPHLSDDVFYGYAREYLWCHTQLEIGATINGQYARDTEHMGELAHEYATKVYKLHGNDAPTHDQRRAISGAFLLIFS